MGCSNARLLVQAPLTGETAPGSSHPLAPSATVPASSPAPNALAETNNSATRMHLTGVDLVVERNGSYTLLLTPKTHKQLMPYVLRKKRFRILVDKPRTDPALVSNEPVVMEHTKENAKRKSTVEAVEQMASQELEKARTRLLAGQSLDRVNVDEEEYIHSEDEGMIEEIVTTVEQDKDLECKVKKKIETKKTIAQQPNSNNTITKVVKTEVTEITRTITINDHHDLERAKRELGIDDVNRLLPSSTWIEQSHASAIKEKHYEPVNEIVTSKDFPSDSPIKQAPSPVTDDKPSLAESTLVGRGPVLASIPPLSTKVEEKPAEVKKKKKKSKLCSCTRSSADDEQERPKTIIIPPTEPTKKLSPAPVASAIQTQLQGQKLISEDLKQLIIDKKALLIEYIHSKIFSPANLFSSNEQDLKAKKISSRILDLLRYDRCSSWSQMYEQLTEEYAGNPIADQCLKPMVNTYENLFTSKQANLLNTFSTIHHGNDIENIPENNDYLNIAQTHIQQSAEKSEEVPEPAPEITPTVASSNDEEEVIKKEDVNEERTKELDMPDETEQELPVYNEEYLIKMLGDISQHKPITLAEAIAYEYLDLEDPKLGLSNETIQRIRSLFRPLTDDSASNVIRVKRAGEHLTDINLSETNPFEKFTENEPLIYQLQQTFEPTLDFNEKQFRSLTDAVTNNKNQYDDLEFDVARTSLPVYDLKESSANDFSQSDSGYSMTTATHESLASKFKIEFEPISQELGPIPAKSDDQDEIEKVDLDKATPEQLDKYELSPELIQIIKSDFNGTDKTVGQAILSRELRLDSNDPSDVSYLNSLGIHKEQTRILTALFFPRQTRTIAYSPEPGRFVEAQTTFNPDYPGYKTDTTIIQIQEKQLSPDPLLQQKSGYDERTVSREAETEEIKPVAAAPPRTPPSSPVTKTTTKEIAPAPAPVPAPVTIKKRKSSSGAGLLSCFKSKKAKPGTEQQGPPTIVVTQTTTSIEETKKPAQEKAIVDYAVLPDGKRIYIDLFRDRPGLDMSYRPDNFENRFVLPETKPAAEYERAVTPEVDSNHEPLLMQSKITENEPVASVLEEETRPAIAESVDVQSEAPAVPEPQSEVQVEPPSVPSESADVQSEVPAVVETEPESDLESRAPVVEVVDAQVEPAPIVASEPHVHLTPRPATIEPVDVQPEITPIVIPARKSEDETGTKKFSAISLHGAAVQLPSVPLVVPGPLPTIPSLTKERKETKVKKSAVGLCAACFGAKSAQKKKRSLAAEPVQAPLEQERIVTTEKQTVITPIAAVQSATTTDKPSLPPVNIDQFRERTLLKGAEVIAKPEVQVRATAEKPVQVVELHRQAPTHEPVASSPRDTSIFSTVNIDSFQERALSKGSETNLKTESRPEPATVTVTRAVVSSEEPRYQAPTNEPVPQSVAAKGTSIFSQVNIDTFKERIFQKSSESLPKITERLEATDIKGTPTEEPSYHPPANEDSTPPPPYESVQPSALRNTSILSPVNIDTFRERTFEKSSPSLPRSTEHIEQITESLTSSTPPPAEETQDQSPTTELSTTPAPVVQSTDQSIEPTTPKDASSSSTVNIDSFQERTLQKGSESRPTSVEPLERTEQTVPDTVSAPEEPHEQSSATERPTTPVPLVNSINQSIDSTTSRDASTFSAVNIDSFQERTLQKGSENRSTSSQPLEQTEETPAVIPPAPEEPQEQSLAAESSTTTSPVPLVNSTNQSAASTTSKDASIFSTVNIDSFQERTLQKGSEGRPKAPEETVAVVTPAPEEPHYQSPARELSTTPAPLVNSTNQSTGSTASKNTSIFSTVNIDSFQERILSKGSESRPTSAERLEQTVAAPARVAEEPHYQSPTNEPAAPPPFPTSKSLQSTNKDASIFSQVNIDSFRERTFDKSPQKAAKVEESPYELPSSEPVPLITPSAVENTYDTPRSLELQQTEGQIINNETMIPSRTDIQKSSGDYLSSATTKQLLSKVEEISPITTETRKGSSTLPTAKKQGKEPKRKTNKKAKAPALDLPAVERDLSPNNVPRPPHRHDSDPLRVPAVDLPKLDLPLPTYDRPEVKMSTGQIKHTSEFAIPTVNFSPIPNLELPANRHQPAVINAKEMKAPNVQLPSLKYTTTDESTFKLPEIERRTKSEVISPAATVTTQVIKTIRQSPEQQITLIDTHLVQSSNVPTSIGRANVNFPLPSPEPVLIVPKDARVPPSFDDDVPSAPRKIVPAVQTAEKQLIEPQVQLKKKSSTLALCSCFGEKSPTPKENPRPIIAPTASLPAVTMPLPSSNIASTLKSKGPLRAPSNALPVLDLTAKSSDESKTVSSESKPSSSFDGRAPSVDLSAPSATDAFLSSSKQEETISIPEQLPSRSDSGLEVTASSPIPPSSTLGDIAQLPSASSGFGSDLFENMTAKGLSLPSISAPEPTLVPPELKHDFARRINLTDDTQAKLIFRETELRTRLETELAQSIPEFDGKKDHKSLDRILSHAIDLIKEKKVATYPELKQKLLLEHRNETFLVDPVVHSLYYTIENHGLDSLDKPEFPLAIRDMVRLPAKQTYDTVAHLNKEATSLTTAPMTKETLPAASSVRSCLTCGRAKSKTTLPAAPTGAAAGAATTSSSSSSSLLDERRRTQLNTYRTDLGNVLREHIQSSSPPIRKFAEHPKDIDKIVRKSLTLLSQSRVISYEQVRHDLKAEFKASFYLVDPIVDIVRDTFDHCDITQLNEKTNLDVLDSQISQTAQLYNNQMHLLAPAEQHAFNGEQLSWLQAHLLDQETREKKLTRKQTREMNKILHRSLDILSSNTMTTWDEFNLQLQREYPKAQDLCQRSTEILRQAQRNGLFLLQQAPSQEKRRASSLITDRARQNLKANRTQIIASLKSFFSKHQRTAATDDELENLLKKTFSYLEEPKAGQLKSYQDLKEQLKKDFAASNQNPLIEQIVDVIEQAHATNQFDDIDKPEVQTLMRDRLDGKPLIIKEMYVSLPPRVGAYGEDPEQNSSSAINGERTTLSHPVARGLSWREANERARILFYRGKHPAIHYDEQAAAFDVRMLLETASGGTQEIPVTDSDVHELLNSCGVQWDGVNIISLVDHSEDVVRAAEQAALKVIREKGLVDLRTPPTTTSSTSTSEPTPNETLHSTS